MNVFCLLAAEEGDLESEKTAQDYASKWQAKSNNNKNNSNNNSKLNNHQNKSSNHNKSKVPSDMMRTGWVPTEAVDDTNFTQISRPERVKPPKKDPVEEEPPRAPVIRMRGGSRSMRGRGGAGRSFPDQRMRLMKPPSKKIPLKELKRLPLNEILRQDTPFSQILRTILLHEKAKINAERLAKVNAKKEEAQRAKDLNPTTGITEIEVQRKKDEEEKKKKEIADTYKLVSDGFISADDFKQRTNINYALYHRAHNNNDINLGLLTAWSEQIADDNDDNNNNNNNNDYQQNNDYYGNNYNDYQQNNDYGDSKIVAGYDDDNSYNEYHQYNGEEHHEGLNNGEGNDAAENEDGGQDSDIFEHYTSIAEELPQSDHEEPAPKPQKGKQKRRKNDTDTYGTATSEDIDDDLFFEIDAGTEFQEDRMVELTEKEWFTYFEWLSMHNRQRAKDRNADQNDVIRDDRHDEAPHKAARINLETSPPPYGRRPTQAARKQAPKATPKPTSQLTALSSQPKQAPPVASSQPQAAPKAKPAPKPKPVMSPAQLKEQEEEWARRKQLRLQKNAEKKVNQPKPTANNDATANTYSLKVEPAKPASKKKAGGKPLTQPEDWAPLLDITLDADE